MILHQFEDCMQLMRSKPNEACKSLQRELDKFFKSTKCKSILYTENTDRSFFGMSVIPMQKSILDELEKEKLNDIKPFGEYVIEIDSKLFNPLLDLSNKELTAVLLHEVGHIVNSNKNMIDIRTAIDIEGAKNGETIAKIENPTMKYLFIYAICRTLRLNGSIFEKEDEELIADQFAVQCGYGRHLESAFGKLIKTKEIYPNRNDKKNKFLNIIWAVRIYNDFSMRQIFVRKTIEEMNRYSGSKLEQGIFKNILNNIKYLRLFRTPKEQTISEEVLQYVQESNFFKNIRMNGLKTIENNLYEYNLRIKNVDTELEAIDILRALNYRINIIDEYLTHEKNLKEEEFDRWNDLKNKYLFLRTELMNTKAYRRKQYGLFVQIEEE